MGLEKRLEGPAQLLNGAKDRVLRCAGIGLQNAGDFLDSTTVPVAHDKSGPLGVAELVKRLLYALAQLHAVHQALRVGAGIRDVRERVLLAAVKTVRIGCFLARFFLLALAHAVNRIVRGDAIDPRAKVRAGLEFFKLLIGAQERLLDDFLGVVLVAGQAIGQPVYVAAIALDQKAIAVPIAGE